MSVEILMPELGESVHEGTVSRWLKQIGEYVKEDEPVVEIMTDKVNTELPSPASGVLSKILVPEGGAVAVFSAMGVIEEGVTELPKEAATVEAPPTSPVPQAEAPAVFEADGGRRVLTPVVRAMARENGLNDAELSSIRGTGEGGRITKRDLEAYIAGGRSKPAPTHRESTGEFLSAGRGGGVPSRPHPAPVAQPEPVSRPAGAHVQALSGLRKMTAEAMMRSAQVPTVSTVTEVDVTRMVQFRERNKDSFLQENGVKLTYTPFFIKAAAEALIEFPTVNASLQADNQILMNDAVHMGVAVALGKSGDEGLIVPVIRNCGQKSVVQLARDLDALAAAARSNALSVSDVQGATFTLTNPGTYGALFGTPMIVAPQAGILGTYAIKKQPVVIEDMIAIRSIMHLVLTYDHRIVDGLLAGRFLASVRDRLQAFDFWK
jgi:pyruvate/2-oxoglutarate dehydrogenase complex dihydrolipoamide acyltransferase (E2) component